MSASASARRTRHSLSVAPASFALSSVNDPGDILPRAPALKLGDLRIRQSAPVQFQYPRSPPAGGGGESRVECVHCAITPHPKNKVNRVLTDAVFGFMLESKSITGGDHATSALPHSA
jgi:hypothetical protein